MHKVFKFKEAIAIFISIASSVLFIKADWLIKLTSKQLIIYPALLNIIALLCGIFLFSIFRNDYYLIKRKHGEYDSNGENDIIKISAILNISKGSAKYFIERTSAIIGQLVRNFSLFLWPLIIFYSLNLVKDLEDFKFQPEFKELYSLYDYVSLCGANFFNVAFGYLSLSALANIFNFISGIGLWVCFSILYQKTLDADNKSTLHFGIYYFLFIAYILSYFVLLGIGLKIMTIKNTILLLDLCCSVFNCVAMILFFNRLVQILYFFQSSLQQKLLDKFYFFIATILFPLYACFQIFFAVFDQLIDSGQNEASLTIYIKVKGIVFFVCFIGKMFLILFLFTFITIKWLHSAILTLLVYENTPIELARGVSAISDSIDKFNDDMDTLKEA